MKESSQFRSAIVHLTFRLISFELLPYPFHYDWPYTFIVLYVYLAETPLGLPRSLIFLERRKSQFSPLVSCFYLIYINYPLLFIPSFIFRIFATPSAVKCSFDFIRFAIIKKSAKSPAGDFFPRIGYFSKKTKTLSTISENLETWNSYTSLFLINLPQFKYSTKLLINSSSRWC